MSHTAPLQHSACIVADVQPLFAELRDTVNVHFRGQNDADRAGLEHFIQQIFQATYGAELGSFYPNLTAFTTDNQLRGVVGYRDGMVKPLFSEQYLDAPVETVMSRHLKQEVRREQLVEVGNLALANPGEARWVIAAMTAFLHAAGYRWVLFTVVKPLFNAFQRLGLRPIEIATPDPARLSDGGRSWGSYYQAGPVVCAGDIEAGYRKLSAHVSSRQPRLQALLNDAWQLGARCRQTGESILREAV